MHDTASRIYHKIIKIRLEPGPHVFGNEIFKESIIWIYESHSQSASEIVVENDSGTDDYYSYVVQSSLLTQAKLIKISQLPQTFLYK